MTTFYTVDELLKRMTDEEKRQYEELTKSPDSIPHNFVRALRQRIAEDDKLVHETLETLNVYNRLKKNRSKRSPR